jgi:hypothetical protein
MGHHNLFLRSASYCLSAARSNRLTSGIVVIIYNFIG